MESELVVLLVIEFEAGFGDTPSPEPAGWKFVNLGSFAGAGPSELSRAPISSGAPSRDPP